MNGDRINPWRSHRFTPLTDVMSSDVWRTGTPSHLAPRLQASVSDGFQQGMDRGYAAGHEAGLREGQATGLAQGQVEGRRQGIEAGQREARSHFETLAAPVDAMLESLKSLQSDYQTALRKEVVELVAKVARQVIRCELALQPAQLLTLVDETLATMPPTPESAIEVYLSESDLTRILEIDHSRASRWTLLADPRLEPGECRVKSGSREADAGCRQRLTACMDQIATQLLPHSEDMEAAA